MKITSSLIVSPIELSIEEEEEEEEGTNIRPLTTDNNRSTILSRTNSLTLSNLFRSWLPTSYLARKLPHHLLDIDVSH